MNQFRVPKRRAEVEIVLPGGASHSLAVFLAEFAQNHVGAERLSDLLNGSHDFIPAVDPARDEVTFLNRASIAVARIAPDFETGGESDYTLPSEHEVEISLVDGTLISGLVSFVLPPERSRLIDFLNDAPPFFRVLEPERISLVNKRHVARVVTISR